MRATVLTPRPAHNPVKPNAPIKKPNNVVHLLGQFARLQVQDAQQQVRRKLDFSKEI